MRQRFGLLGMGLLAAAAMSGAAVSASVGGTAGGGKTAIVDEAQAGKTTRQEKRRTAPGYRSSKLIRSRGPAAPKKKRPNRNHISRRVKRKHRRAA